MKKRAAERPPYRLFLKPSVHGARKRLPGNFRQRIGRAIDDLGRDPRPAKSRELRLPAGLQSTGPAEWEVRRLQVEKYRIVYAISETWKEVGVLAVEQRPPYNYEDLERLLAELFAESS